MARMNEEFRRRILPVIPVLYPAIPYSRHSRESGNPDGCSQSSHMKPSINHSQWIPSPFMGEG